MSQSNRNTFAPTIEQLREMFEDRIWISISPEDIKNAEQKLDTYSSNRSRKRGLINYLCQQKLIPIIQEYSDREPKLHLPQDSNDRMASLWDILNGFSLTVDGYKLVVIPSECIDLEEFSIPKEWMDIPELRGDYYLAVQVDLEDGWLSVWGYATHQEIKNGSEYSPVSLSYSLDEGDMTTDVNLIWTAIDLGIKEVVNLNPIPDLSPVLATELIEQLSKPSLFDIRHDLEFEQWAGIIKDARWRTQLYRSRTASLRSVQVNPVQRLSNWLYGFIPEPWVTFSPSYSLNLRSNDRLRSDKAEEAIKILNSTDFKSITEKEIGKLQEAIIDLENNGRGDDKEVQALTRLIDGLVNGEETRWRAADLLYKIDNTHPFAGIQRGILFDGQDIILKIGIIPLLKNKFSVRVTVSGRDDRLNQLPNGLKMMISLNNNKIFHEDTLQQGSDNIRYICRFDKGENFTVCIESEKFQIRENFSL
jgi:Protein of unknown function (DUF1822)